MKSSFNATVEAVKSEFKTLTDNKEESMLAEVHKEYYDIKEEYDKSTEKQNKKMKKLEKQLTEASEELSNLKK